MKSKLINLIKGKNKILKTLAVVITTAFIFPIFSSANAIEQSNIYQGIKNLLSDLLIKGKNKILKTLAVVITTAFIFPIFSSANAIEQSNIYQGIKNLLSDLSSVIIGIAIIGGGVAFAGCHVIKMFVNNSHEEEKYNKWAKRILWSAILVLSAGGIMNIVSHYFK